MSSIRTEKSFVLRGSSWDFDARLARVICRGANEPSHHGDLLGLRLMRRAP